MKVFFWIFLLSPYLVHAAEEGALPRGKDPGPGVKYKIPQFQDPDGDCHQYHLNPEHGYIGYNPFAKTIYFFGKNKTLPTGEKARSYVMELHLKDRTIKKRLLLKVSDTASLIADREPTEAVTVLNFKKASFACGQGVSSGVGVRWTGKQEVVKSFIPSRYKILRASTGHELVDRNDNGVRIFDLRSMQRRLLATLPDTGIPLYLDLNSNESIHFDRDRNGILKRFDLSKKNQLKGELRLAKGMRIIQQQEKFAVAYLDPENQLIKVNAVRGWTGNEKAQFSFKSSVIPIEKVRLSVDFETGVGLLSGRHQEIARDWRDAEIVHGGTGQGIRRIKAPQGEYVALLELLPHSPWAIVITKNITDDSFGTVSLYHMKEDRVDQIHLK